MMQQNEDMPREQSALARIVRLVVGGLLVIFTIGVVAGFGMASHEKGDVSLKGIALVSLIVLLCGSLAWWLLRKGSEGEWLPRSPRQRTNRMVLYGTVALGVVAGFLMQLGEQRAPGDFNILPYDAPLNPAVALALLIAMPLLGWLYYRWHQSADEHDLDAYNFGGMLSLYAFFFLSIGWWIAWRGGFVPEPQGYAVFWTVIIVWSLGWMWRRYR